GAALSPIERSALLLACAPVLEAQIAELFGIDRELAGLRAATLAHDPVFAFKKQVVLKRVRRRLLRKDDYESSEELDRWLDGALRASGHAGPDRELAVARWALALLDDEATHADALEKLTRWCVRAMTSREG